MTFARITRVIQNTRHKTLFTYQNIEYDRWNVLNMKLQWHFTANNILVYAGNTKPEMSCHAYGEPTKKIGCLDYINLLQTSIYLNCVLCTFSCENSYKNNLAIVDCSFFRSKQKSQIRRQEQWVSTAQFWRSRQPTSLVLWWPHLCWIVPSKSMLMLCGAISMDPWVFFMNEIPSPSTNWIDFHGTNNHSVFVICRDHWPPLVQRSQQLRNNLMKMCTEDCVVEIQCV